MEGVKIEAEPLCRMAGVEKLIMSGSYAGGRQTAASDVDFDRTYRILSKGIGLRMVELHILSREEYLSTEETRWIKTIEKEGKTVISREPLP